MIKFDMDQTRVRRAALRALPGPSYESTRFVSQIILFSAKKNVLSILKNKGKNALGREYPSRWDFPGGGVEKGETFFTAACRELWEETKLEAPSLVPFSLSMQTTPDRTGSYALLTFLAEIEEEVPVQVDSNEHIDYIWCNLREIPSPQTHRLEKFLEWPDVKNISTDVFIRDILRKRQPMVPQTRITTQPHPFRPPFWGG